MDDVAGLLKENFEKMLSKSSQLNQKISDLIEFCNRFYKYDKNSKDLSFLESLKKKRGVCRHWGMLFRLGLWYILIKGYGGVRVDNWIDLSDINIALKHPVLYPVGSSYFKVDRVKIGQIIYNKHDYTLISLLEPSGIGYLILVSSRVSENIPGMITKDDVVVRRGSNFSIDLEAFREDYKKFINKLGLV